MFMNDNCAYNKTVQHNTYVDIKTNKTNLQLKTSNKRSNQNYDTMRTNY